MTIKARVAVAAGFALAATIAAALPATASATTASTASTAAARPAAVQSTSYRLTPVPAGGRVSCYGYYGTFKVGTKVMVVDWIHTSDECFGIATDGTVWHTWPSSGGWTRMGGTFHADDISGPYPEQANGTKGVEVWLAGSNQVWYQRYAPPLGWTSEWTRV
jgi:hypothetical protein